MSDAKPYCYNCNTEITKSNETEEHIILNSIGGRLKSTRILCSGCNISFSGEDDKHLSMTLNPIANMLSIKRDRGTPQPVKGTLEKSNKEVLIDHDGGIRFFRERAEIKLIEQKDGKSVYQVSAPNMQQARKAVMSIARKDSKVSKEELLEKLTELKPQKVEIDEHVKISFAFELDKLAPSIARVALGYYFHTNHKKENVEDFLSKFKSRNLNGIILPFFKSTPIFQTRDTEVLHGIALKADSNQKILYCYVEFFSFLKFVVVLSENYIGEDFSEHYLYDVKKGSIILDRTPCLNIHKNKFKKLHKDNGFPQEKLLDSFRRVIKIAQERKSFDNVIGNAVTEAWDKTLGQYPLGITITPEMMNEFHAALWPLLEPELLKRIVRR